MSFSRPALIAFFLSLAVLIPARAQPGKALGFAGYHLGMTNAAAAAIGLSLCAPSKDDAKRIRCNGADLKLPDMPNPAGAGYPAVFNGPFVDFDARTKRVIAIEFWANNWWPKEDPRTPQLLKLLRVPDCDSAWMRAQDSELQCFGPPDQVVSVRYAPEVRLARHHTVRPHLMVEAKRSSGAVAMFQRQKAEQREKERREKAASRAAADIQAGR